MNVRIAILPALVWLSACSLIESDPLEAARDAYAEQDYVRANDLTLAALQAEEGSADALELLTRIQLAMGQGNDALATLERLAEADTASTGTAVLRAEALLQTGRTAEALKILEREDSAESWRLRALAAAQAGDDRSAATAFRNGQDAPGDKRKLYTAQASFHLARGDAEAARLAVGHAQRIAPDSIETLFVSARLAELNRRPDLASRAYLAILERAPNDRPAMLGAIKELDKLGRIDLVRSLIQRGRAAYPQDVEFLYQLASLHAYDGDWRGVRSLLQDREDAVARHPNARGLYAEALLELGQLEQARAQIVPLVRRFPGNSAYSNILSRIEQAS